jgi:Tfp pilus assembly protein PilF
LLSLAALLAFGNSVSGAFVLDDIPAIVENLHIRSLTPISRAIDAPAESTAAGRPVLGLSLALNYAMSGGNGAPPTPFAFHLGNLAIHILAGLTLFGVVRRTLRTPPLTRRLGPEASPLAFVVALLWIVHPLATAAVTYIVQRAEALMGLFLLLTLYAAIRAHGRHASRWRALAILACALGVGSKETMVVAPLVVIAWDWFFADDPGESPPAPFGRRWPLYAGLVLTWGILAITIPWGSRAGAVGFGFAEWPWWRYLTTQAGVIVHYLRLAFVPVPLVLDYGWRPVTSLSAALPSLLFVGSLAMLTAFGTWKRHPAGFAGVVFFLVLAPTSSVLPIVTEVAAEHRMYVPLAAVVGISVCGIFAYGRRLRIPAIAGLCAAGGAAILFGWVTHERNEDFASEERIWADTLEKRPDNPRAHINYGVVLLGQQRVAEAEPHLSRAVALDATDSDALLALGAALCSTGRCEQGVDHLRRAAQIDPNDPNVVRNLAEALAARGERREAAAMFRRAVDLSPDDVFLLNQASWLLATAPEDDVRDGSAALTMAERAVALTGRRDPISLDSVAVAYAELNRFQDALAVIDEAIAVARRAGDAGREPELQAHRTAILAQRPIR